MKINGILESFEVKDTGKRNDGTEWTRYSYKINGKYFSGFEDPTSFLKKSVEVEYTEKENPGKQPYKNVQSIKELEGEAEVLAENNYVEEKNQYLFGQVFNKTCDFINAKIISGDKEASYKDDFEKSFSYLWEIGLKKRKEKLGY